MNAIGLNELTWENVGKWPLYVKLGLFFGASVLIIAFGYWLIIRDCFSELNQLRNQEITLKTDFEEKQSQLYHVPVYREQVQIMQERFVLLLKQLSEKNEMPGLLEEVSQKGAASGLRFELFAPQPKIIHDFYIELPIKISVVGTYSQLAVFVSRIAQMDRIITLHNFTIEKLFSKDHKEVLEDGLVMNVIARIYQYRAP